MNDLRTHLSRLYSIFFLSLYLLGFSNTLNAQNTAHLDNIVDVTQWINVHFDKGKLPPFAFRYNNINSQNFITHWKYNCEELSTSTPKTIQKLITYQDPISGLKIECTVTGFKEFNAVEWVIRLTNTSKTNTPIMDEFKVLNQTYESRKKGAFTLLHARGSCGSKADFMVSIDTLASSPLHMAPQGGRSSDNTALPFFNLMAPGQQSGVLVAVGWTGSWQADLVVSSNETVSLHSGMERFRLYLQPGETIRTPMICLMFWEGNHFMQGQNKFRRFQQAYHSRHIDGKPVRYPYASGFPAYGPKPCTEGGCLTEEIDIALMRRYKQFDILPECFWLDAGWYTDSGAPVYDWCDCVGSWTPDSTRYPRGLKPVAEEAHRLGAKFLLWFEPERVSRGSWLAVQHPEWLLHSPIRNSALLDLGNPEALHWLQNHVGDMIEEVGIDIYRQDFNHPGKPFWEANEEPDRIGMMEIRHIEGLYAFWDYLLDRFPNLLIDNCAAGGRRIDLEMMSRSVPLWRTDYQYDEPTGKQGHFYGLSFFLAQHGSGISDTDNYSVRSNMGACQVSNFDITTNRLSLPDIQQAIATFKKYRHYYLEDYYPLTGIIDAFSDKIWIAYQMHCPSDNSGIVMAFRRPESNVDRIKVYLQGIDPGKIYNLYNDNTKHTQCISGRQLAEGFYLNIPQARGSLLLHYQCIE